MDKAGRNNPCPCGSGKKYKKCHGSPFDNSETIKVATTRGFRVSQDFNDRLKLAAVGPVIKGGWHVSPSTERELVQRNQPIPQPIQGYMLIDTGAGTTVMDEGAARELGLTPISNEHGWGVTGRGTLNIYSAAIMLYVGDIHGESVGIKLFADFIAAPNIREEHDTKGLKAPDGSPMRVIGLLGRDILKFAKLNYDGLKGSWDMEIDGSILRQVGGGPAAS